MTKRRAVWIGVAAAVALGLTACAAWWMLVPRHRINYDRAELLRPGMTLAELEALFGVPPGDYATTPSARAEAAKWEGQPAPRAGYERIGWLSDEVYILCQVRREDGNIQDVAQIAIGPPSVPLWDRIKRWLGL
jgi:hypothetical protein